MTSAGTRKYISKAATSRPTPADRTVGARALPHLAAADPNEVPPGSPFAQDERGCAIGHSRLLHLQRPTLRRCMYCYVNQRIGLRCRVRRIAFNDDLP